MQSCLINQSACGRVAGNPVCPKCGMDERVVYPGEADREAAQTAGLARYWEAHARELERQAKEAEQVKAQTPPPVQPPPAPSPQSQPVPSESPPAPPAKSGGFNWAWIPMVVAMLGVSVYFKFQKEQDQRRVEEFGRAVAQASSPSTAERILNGAPPDAAQQAAAAAASAAVRPPDAAQEAAAAAASAAVRQAFEPKMVRIPAGSFTMGSPDSEPDRDPDEGPQHKVQVAAFELAKYEVTFAQWDACVDDGGCSHRPDDGGASRGDTPVMRVSWNDITQEYIPWLNGKTGKQYRLPSEAEWEYAARAGCKTPFNVGGQCVSKIEPGQANFDGNHTYNGSAKGEYLQHRSAVGSYAANNWGLHDMHGNVWEWVQDCSNANYNGAPSDGGAWSSGDCSGRMVRGGSWNIGPQDLRSADRGGDTPHSRVNSLGFRLARSVS